MDKLERDNIGGIKRGSLKFPLFILGAATTGPGLLKNTLATPADIEDPSLSGVYAYGPSGASANERGVLFAYPNTSSQNGYRAIQVLYLVDGLTKSRTYESNRWGSWYRTDNFGCATPEALASLLGGLFPFGENIDANTITRTSIVCYAGASDTANHIPYGFGIMLTILYPNATYTGLQIFFRRGDNHIYHRTKNNDNEWESDWHTAA